MTEQQSQEELLPDTPNDSGAPVILYISTLLIAGGSSLPFGVMDDLAKEHGLSRSAVGVIAAAAFVGAFISQFTIAQAADRGYARRLIIGGALADILSLVGFAVSSQLWLFVLSRLFAGIAAGALLPAVRSVVVRTNPSKVAERLGHLSGFEIGGFVTAPILGTLVSGELGVAVPFLVMAGILALLIPALLLTPIPEVDRANARNIPRIDTRALLAHRGVGTVVLASVALFLPVGIYDALWQVYMNDIGASRVELAISLAVFAIPLTFLAWLGGRVVARFGEWNVLRVGVWGVFLATASYGLISAPVAVILVGGVEALIQTATVPATQHAMVKAAPEEYVAQAQGLALAGNQVAAFTAALVGGFVYDHAGQAPTFIGAGIAMTAIWMIVLVRLRRER